MDISAVLNPAKDRLEALAAQNHYAARLFRVAREAAAGGRGGKTG